MRDSKHHAITQTIQMNLISWVCCVTQATKYPNLRQISWGAHQHFVHQHHQYPCLVGVTILISSLFDKLELVSQKTVAKYNC